MHKTISQELRFDQLAELVKDGYKPTGSDGLLYIGLEHIDQQSLSLNSVGSSADITSNKFLFKTGDILFGKLRPYFRKVYRPSFGGVCSTDIWVVRAKEGVDQGYLFYLMANPEFVELASSGSSGTRMPRADWNHLRNTTWPIPPLSTQRKIAKILGDLDAKIELNQQMNKTLEAMAQALFKRWFVDFKFPGHEKIKCVDGLPEGWRRGTLGDISTLSAGGDRPEVVSEKPSSACTIPIYSNGIDNDGLYGYTNLAKILDESVTVSARGTIGFTCLRQIPYFPIVRLVSLVPNTKYLSATYLYLWLKSINISGTGTTQQQLTVPDFRKTEILIPAPEIMKRFTGVASAMFIKITANKNEIAAISAVRDSLLPRLMSGAISV